MKTGIRIREKIEFGDFQTPVGLAREVASQVKAADFAPASILEPSCGVGNMLLAAADAFPTFNRAVGVEFQPGYADELLRRCEVRDDRNRIAVHIANFFDHDWRATLSGLPDPLLLIGNPPWVTNSVLSAMQSRNLPTKSNFQGCAGLDALTGKSNFDISEAMLLQIVGWLAQRNAMLAMLCKTAVARKVLAYAWRNGLPMGAPSVRRIDSARYFNASVDACLFVCRFGSAVFDTECPVFNSLTAQRATQTIAYREGRLLADADAFDRWRHLEGEEIYRWRSGIKHDCADAVELLSYGNTFRTRGGETLDVERHYLFPMLKASDLNKGRVLAPKRWMLVTQRTVGDDTAKIAIRAPKTWAYLQRNAHKFEKRASVIYRNRPAFSMFGVGEYTFAPWKVGIAGLYKTLEFTAVGPFAGKPVVLDDTCNFISCQNQEEAETIADMLNNKVTRAFYSAFLFWDAKRPVTVELLRRLDLRRLAVELGVEDRWSRITRAKRSGDTPLLFD